MLSSCEQRREARDMKVLSQEVYQMRQCQRRADNLNFYLHKYRAERLIDKYKGDYMTLQDTCQRQFMLASTRYSIVYSDYLMQIGNHEEAINVMDKLASSNTLNLNADTLLWLNYLSHQAAVRYIPVDLNKNRKDIEKGYDCLMQCYILASRNNIALYQGVSMQLLSQYLAIKGIFRIVRNFDAASLRYINEDGVPDSLLAGNLAQRALTIFLRQKDTYLTVGGWRNLALCYFDIGDYVSTINCLNNALAIPDIDSMPDLKASVSEQLSMAYAAIDNKSASDFYRNQYLDLQDSTRQDRQLEARVVALGQKTTRIWILVAIAVGVFLVLCVTTYVLVRIRRRKQKKATASEEELEELEERLAKARVELSDSQRANVELRAQVSVIKGMLPLVERMRNAIEHGDNDYAIEVARDIDMQNAQLTKWIKLQQGSIAPKIETLAVSDIFDIVRSGAKSHKAKESDAIQLIVEDTTATVKADRTLTLFIINTLIENARKALEGKGTITVSCSASQAGRYAEISVADTGKGMTASQLSHLFEVKPIKDEDLQAKRDALDPKDSAVSPRSHGFGLQNCRGIMDKYRKISSLFSVCDITAKSQPRVGTTISFRLPLVLKMLVLLLLLPLHLSASTNIESYADSLYKNNLEGNYVVAMQYADSCCDIIDKSGNTVGTETRLSIYNETAVAALALHQWQKYLYFNYLYTNLYKEYTEDKSLPEYISEIHRSKMIANIIMLLVVLLTIALIPIFWFVYLRPVIRFRKNLSRQKKSIMEECAVLESKANRLHVMNNVVSNQLSTVKHETMYYPARISQMMTMHEAFPELLDTVKYYSRLYALLSNNMIAEQLSSAQFAVHKVQMDDRCILANDELLTFLLLLLKRHNAGHKPVSQITGETEKYVTVTYLMDHADFTADDVNALFSISTIHTDYLVMRQIMREIGDASISYGTGITATVEDGQKKINVTFPKVGAHEFFRGSTSARKFMCAQNREESNPRKSSAECCLPLKSEP